MHKKKKSSHDRKPQIWKGPLPKKREIISLFNCINCHVALLQQRNNIQNTFPNFEISEHGCRSFLLLYLPQEQTGAGRCLGSAWWVRGGQTASGLLLAAPTWAATSALHVAWWHCNGEKRSATKTHPSISSYEKKCTYRTMDSLLANVTFPVNPRL